jgi:hypothetical protein
MSNSEKKVLYVGADDSNHAGENVKGEIILATFSYNHADSLVRLHKNRRDQAATVDWIKTPGNYYLYTLLTEESYRRRGDNLPKILPFLVKRFLASNERPEALKLYLDGPLSWQDKDYLREEFKHIPKVVIANFIKKRNINGVLHKRPICPNLVYIADNLAHGIFPEALEKILSSTHFVPLSSI